MLIYCFSFFLRNILFEVEKKSGFTEAGLFLISFLFLGYLLNLLNIDKNVKNYFPNKILIDSGVSFIFIFIMSFLSNSSQGKWKFINVIILLTVLYLLQSNNNIITSFMVNNPKVSDIIIGAPIIYLGLLLTGLRNYSPKSSIYKQQS